MLLRKESPEKFRLGLDSNPFKPLLYRYNTLSIELSSQLGSCLFCEFIIYPLRNIWNWHIWTTGERMKKISEWPLQLSAQCIQLSKESLKKNPGWNTGSIHSLQERHELQLFSEPIQNENWLKMPAPSPMKTGIIILKLKKKTIFYGNFHLRRIYDSVHESSVVWVIFFNA